LIFPIAISILVTIACFLNIDNIFKGRKPIFSAILAGLSIPVLLVILMLLFTLTPNPNHFDGPGMGVAACVMLEYFALPLGLATSFAIFVVRQMTRRR